MSLIRKIGAKQLGILATLLSLWLADDLAADELNTLGNFVVGIGCILLIIAAQKEFLKNLNDTSTQKDTLQELVKRLERLETGMAQSSTTGKQT